MKYTFETDAPMCSLEEFATKHGLEMVVTERPLDEWHRKRHSPRYMARFRRVEVKQGACLASLRGEGNTPDEAIKDYMSQILGERMVYDAMGNNRREITVPNEWRVE